MRQFRLSFSKKCSLFLLGLFMLLYGNHVNARALESKTDRIFQTFRFGLFVGPTFNRLKPTASSADGYHVTEGPVHTGFSFGIVADYNVNERYTLFTGAGIDWRGGRIQVEHDSSVVSADDLKVARVNYKKMQYLSVPLGLKMKAFETGAYKVFAQTGFDFGLLLSQKGDYTMTTATDSVMKGTNEKLGGKATVVPFNIGWSIGIGTEYQVGDKNAFFFSLLYRNGFIDATSPNNNNKGWHFSDGNIRSNAILLRVGYFF